MISICRRLLTGPIKTSLWVPTVKVKVIEKGQKSDSGKSKTHDNMTVACSVTFFNRDDMCEYNLGTVSTPKIIDAIRKKKK